MMEVRPMGPTVWCRAARTYRNVGTGPYQSCSDTLIAIKGADYALHTCPLQDFLHSVGPVW